MGKLNDMKSFRYGKKGVMAKTAFLIKYRYNVYYSWFLPMSPFFPELISNTIKHVLLAEAQIWRVPKNECLNTIFINVHVPDPVLPYQDTHALMSEHVPSRNLSVKKGPREEYVEEGEGEHRANPIILGILMPLDNVRNSAPHFL